MNNDLNGQDRLVTLLVGAGGISRSWIRTLVDHPHVNLVGMVDLDLDQARRRCAEFGLDGLPLGTDLEAMIDKTGARVVCDCTTPAAHADVTRRSLAAGCDVLGEKPFDTSMVSAQETLELVRKSERTYAVMQNRRYNDSIRQVRKTIDSGALGELTILNADFFLGPHFGGFREEMEHVLLLDMAIHSFDQARYLTGSNARSVFCHEWTARDSWFHHGDSAIAIFEMENGVVFTYRGSWSAEGLPTSWECAWRTVGTQGTLTWDGADEIVGERVSGNEGFFRPTEKIELPTIEPLQQTGHAGCIYDMLGALRTGERPQTDCEDNIHSLAMVHGAIASAESGQRIDLRNMNW